MYELNCAKHDLFHKGGRTRRHTGVQKKLPGGILSGCFSEPRADSNQARVKKLTIRTEFALDGIHVYATFSTKARTRFARPRKHPGEIPSGCFPKNSGLPKRAPAVTSRAARVKKITIRMDFAPDGFWIHRDLPERIGRG